MRHPWLSVIVPTYNGGAFLRQALDSIALQHDESVEVLLVDDGSCDETLDIAKGFTARLMLELHQLPHRGNWVANVNRAMSHVRGTYVSILHQDDVWHRNRLSCLKPLTVQYPWAALFVHPCLFIDSVARRVGYWHCPFSRGRKTVPAECALESLLVQCLYAVAAPLFRADAAREVGLLDESLWFSADWDFWLKLSRLTDTVYCPTPLAMFRLHGQSQTILRGGHGDEVHRQQSIVLSRHIKGLRDPRMAEVVEAVARFSIDVNAGLIRGLEKRPIGAALLAHRFMALGPRGWRRYFRDSRVVGRCLSRMRAGATTWRHAQNARFGRCAAALTAGTVVHSGARADGIQRALELDIDAEAAAGAAL